MNAVARASPSPVNNGTVDIRGRIADKRQTGGWKASPFIIGFRNLCSCRISSMLVLVVYVKLFRFLDSVNEVAERLAFFAIGVNMVSYLVFEMRLSLPTAATCVTNWMGAAYGLTLLGAFLADAYLGRFRTIVGFSLIYAVGMVLLTVSASVDGFRPPPCEVKPCLEASTRQISFLYVALALIAVGTGGIKPCVSTFGADQFDETDEKEAVEKYSFFNWFFFAINMGSVFGITLLVYVQVKLGWGWGFGVPTGTMLFSLVVLLAGTRFYRFQKPLGSPFTRFVQVMVSSVRNHWKGVKVDSDTPLFEVQTRDSDVQGVRKLAHSSQYR